MRREIEMWWEQAKRDLISAENSLNSKDYYLCAFMCQQAVEKGLKAVFILKHNSLPPKIHDLVEICRLIKAPENIIYIVGKITPAYILSRYPNVTSEMPADYYDRKKAENYIKLSKEVFEWITKQIK